MVFFGAGGVEIHFGGGFGVSWGLGTLFWFSFLVLSRRIDFLWGRWRGDPIWARFWGFLGSRGPLLVFFLPCIIGLIFFGAGDVGVRFGRGFGVSWGLGTLF